MDEEFDSVSSGRGSVSGGGDDVGSSYYRARYLSMLCDDDSKGQHRQDMTVQEVSVCAVLQASPSIIKNKRPTANSPPSPVTSRVKRQRQTQYSATQAALLILNQQFKHPIVQHVLNTLNLNNITNTTRHHIQFDAHTLLGNLPQTAINALKHLIAQGADPTVNDADGNFPMPLAMHYRNAEQLLIDWIDRHNDLPNDLQWKDYSMADLAITLGHSNLLLKLLQKGMFPTSKTKSDSAVKYLKAHGVHEDAEALLQEAIWHAIQQKDFEKLRNLIHHIEVIDFKDKSNKTPLYIAVEQNCPVDIIQLLLEKGANPNSLDTHGTPMIVFPLMRVSGDAAVKLLLKFNVDLRMPVDDSGQTIAEFAKDAAVACNFDDLMPQLPTVEK